MVDRRTFLASLAVAAASRSLRAQEGSVSTVTGDVPVGELGMVLMHEHVLVDFIGADKVSRSRYDAEAVVGVALPRLREAHELGCRTFVDATPAFLGRNAALLRRLSRESGLRIVTNTGYYGAAGDKYVPAHAFRDSAQQIAQKWIDERSRGIDGTDMLPGFIKTGVDAGPLSEIDRKLIEAAGIAHRATGLPVACHCDDGTAAHQAMDVLQGQGVALDAFIWVHAQKGSDEEIRRGAERGAWVEFDGVAPDSVERHVQLVRMLHDAGHGGRTLVSHDAGWYHVGEEGGGAFRGFDTVFRTFVPAVREALGDGAVNQLLVTNPATALRKR